MRRGTLQVVDFVIGQLFKSLQKPQHLLAYGFQRPSMGYNAPETNIPGVVIQFPNENVRILKESPWADILGLLGQSGDEAMLRLLFDCGIFAPVDAQRGIYYQLSGTSDLAADPFLTYGAHGFPRNTAVIAGTSSGIVPKTRRANSRSQANQTFWIS